MLRPCNQMKRNEISPSLFINKVSNSMKQVLEQIDKEIWNQKEAIFFLYKNLRGQIVK